MPELKKENQMSPIEISTAFFHACEGLQGWAGCQQFVADGARFTAQSEPLVEVETIEAYCEWIAGLGAVPLKGCSYQIHASAYDEANKTALFFATFAGKHVGEGGGGFDHLPRHQFAVP